MRVDESSVDTGSKESRCLRNWNQIKVDEYPCDFMGVGGDTRTEDEIGQIISSTG